MDGITIALSKGRIFEETLPLLAAAGIAGCDLRPLPVRQIGKLVLVGDEQSGIDKSPPLAPRVAAAAALQANAVLHFALRQAAQKSGGKQ